MTFKVGEVYCWRNVSMNFLDKTFRILSINDYIDYQYINGKTTYKRTPNDMISLRPIKCNKLTQSYYGIHPSPEKAGA